MANNISSESSNEEIINIKIIIIGDAGVGKTSLLHRFIFNKFQKDPKQTISVEYTSKLMKIQNKNLRLQLWDTAGQERFKSVTKNFYKNAIGMIIVYDITNNESFKNCESWILDANQMVNKNCCCCLLGNKSDLKNEKKVDDENIKKFCDKYSISSNFECSALTGENIEKVFSTLGDDIVTKINEKKIDIEDKNPYNTIKINENDETNDIHTISCSC